MQEDKKIYQELLKNGKISKEEYDALVIGKITVGIGYNDIRETIKNDSELIRDDVKNLPAVKPSPRFEGIYTDAEYVKDGIHDGQWIIKQNREIKKSNYEARYIHEDDIKVYDSKNMNNTLFLMMKRMEQSDKRNKLPYIKYENNEKELEGQKIINAIATEYYINPEYTKIIATNRIAMIFCNENGVIKICDIFSSPIKEKLSEEQKKKAKKHIKYQMKKALKQISKNGTNVDISSLQEKQKCFVQNILDEIQEERVEISK